MRESTGMLLAAIIVTATLAGAASAQTGKELDLQEANVVDVEFEKTDGTYTFHVTMIHDDDGEPGYADWWQVETPDGTLLGKRELLHAHGTREFTRSETIEIPQNVTRVVIRGHDQTHGYGGRVLILDLETGETETIDQGPEPVNVSTRSPTTSPTPAQTTTPTSTATERPPAGSPNSTPIPTDTDTDTPGPGPILALLAMALVAAGMIDVT